MRRIAPNPGLEAKYDDTVHTRLNAYVGAWYDQRKHTAELQNTATESKPCVVDWCWVHHPNIAALPHVNYILDEHTGKKN